MLPFEAAVTLAMNALCLAANSGLLSREDLLTSDRGDSEPADPVGVFTPVLELVRARKLRLELDSTASIMMLLCS